MEMYTFINTTILNFYSTVFQSRPSAATAASWSRNGLPNSRIPMEMDMSSALWEGLKKD